QTVGDGTFCSRCGRNVTQDVSPTRLCVNSSCKNTLDSDWAFCCFCGSDQRPQADRTQVVKCKHEDVGVGFYCVRCGEKAFVEIDDTSASRRPPGGTFRCQKCGAALDPSVAFCPACGSKAGSEPATDGS